MFLVPSAQLCATGHKEDHGRYRRGLQMFTENFSIRKICMDLNFLAPQETYCSIPFFHEFIEVSSYVLSSKTISLLLLDV